MNKDNAHLYLSLVQALAEGKILQEKCVVARGKIYMSYGWIDTQQLNIDKTACCYRIKPEPKTAWYRVAELKGDEDDMPVNMVWNEGGEREVENNKKTFVRWLTKRLEYEVTE